MKSITKTRTAGTAQNHGGMEQRYKSGNMDITPPPPPHISTKEGAKIQTFRTASSRFTTLAALSLSLAFLGNCGGCGSSKGGGSSGSSAGGTPACTGSQILKDGSCEACTAPQYPNSDRTACVSTCADGELKPMNKPTCETKLSCADGETHNPADNTCITLNCEEGEIADTTASTPVCIERSACRTAPGKLLGPEGESCISTTACTSVAGQLINTDGDCQACTGEMPVVNIEENACISVDRLPWTATAPAPTAYWVTDCITDAACQDMAGHVATDDGLCQQCTGANNVRSVDKRACISAATCQGNSSSPTSLLGTECITDEACHGHGGACRHSRRSLRWNARATRQTSTPARTACGVDGDSDGVIDSEDAFPTEECASVDSDGDGSPDALLEDCASDLMADVDDDNDGLIEIATAAELNNIRHNLAGTSYNDGSTASTAGAPEEATANCDDGNERRLQHLSSAATSLSLTLTSVMPAMVAPST